MNILTTLLATYLILAIGMLAGDPPVLQWSHRLEPTVEQQQLLRLYGDMDASTDPLHKANGRQTRGQCRSTGQTRRDHRYSAG